MNYTFLLIVSLITIVTGIIFVIYKLNLTTDDATAKREKSEKENKIIYNVCNLSEKDYKILFKETSNYLEDSVNISPKKFLNAIILVLNLSTDDLISFSPLFYDILNSTRIEINYINRNVNEMAENTNDDETEVMIKTEVYELEYHDDELTDKETIKKNSEKESFVKFVHEMAEDLFNYNTSEKNYKLSSFNYRIHQFYNAFMNDKRRMVHVLELISNNKEIFDHLQSKYEDSRFLKDLNRFSNSKVSYTNMKFACTIFVRGLFTLY